MVAFFPNIRSQVFGWQLESKINELRDELFTYYPPNQLDISSPQPPQLDSQCLDHSSMPSGDHTHSTKRSIHNEYERDRRKKLNGLYSSLRSVLPEADQSKKLSIPCTVGRVLKYIPELQSNIERLTRKKEEILLRMSSQQERSSSFANGQKHSVGPAISATCLNRREVMVQICIKNGSETIPLSKVVKVLEGEGLRLVNASTIATYADGTLHSLHLQANDLIRVDGQNYCMHLINVLQKQATVSFISCYT